MRIGFFHASLPAANRKPGGVEVYVDRLAEKLTERGHTVRLYTYAVRPSNRHYEHRRLRPARFEVDKLARILLVPVALNALDTSDLDVLHLHGDDWFFVRRRVPTVRTFYGTALHEAKTAVRLRRRVSQLAIVPLELLASVLATRSYGLTRRPGGWARLDGALPLGGLDQPRKVSVTRASHPMILFVGTWEGRKRGGRLWEIFRDEIRPAVPDAELVMVCDSAAPAPGVRLVEHPSDRELAELYAQSWVFCLPSTYEGFGVPYVEAMAASTPAVATPNPGSLYVLDEGRAGPVVAEEELGRQLVALLRHPELREHYAAAGRERVRDFAWEKVLDAHENAYESARREFGHRRHDSRS